MTDTPPHVTAEYMPTAACKDCKFWDGPFSDWKEEGHCRRRSPQLVTVPAHKDRDNSVIRRDGFVTTGFPVTKPDEWCGEYEPK